MDANAAKLLGAGLAAIGVGMAALGVGNVFGSFLESALRNPAAADGQQGRLFIGFAAAELLGLLAFVIAMILLLAGNHGASANPSASRKPKSERNPPTTPCNRVTTDQSAMEATYVTLTPNRSRRTPAGNWARK